MTQRIALALAAALSAFVLVLVGGLGARLSGRQPVAAAPTELPTAAAPTANALDPALQAAIAERDAAYQAALAEANARIEAANAQVSRANARLAAANARVAEANGRPAAVPAPPPSEAPPAQAYAVGAEQAAAIALGVAYGAAPSKAPELVSLQGVPAYEVAFPTGLVYVEASSGAVLASSIPAPAPAQRYDEHEDGEHEGEHEDGEHEGEHEDGEHEEAGHD